MVNSSSFILAGGLAGLAFLIVLGLFSYDVELEYYEAVPVAEAVPVVEAAPVDEKIRHAASGVVTGRDCNPEIDKDGDNVPDNLVVEGPIDWSYCKLEGLNLSNLELSGANLSGSNLYGADLHGTNLSEADLSHTVLYKNIV